MAAILRQTIQEPGLVSRVGGEEFAVVCFDYSHEAFFALAETLRSSLCASPFVVNQQPIPVTVSIGIAHATQAGDDLPHTVHHLVSAADKNLYIAKRHGRNQTVQ